MSTLQNLITPPPPPKRLNNHELSLFLNSIFESLSSLTAIKNISLTTNSDFNTLSDQGLTPTTEADGDDFEFIGDWFVVGSDEATYTLTPTNYANNSPVISESIHFVNVDISDYSGSGLYFYQRQAGMIRKYQQSFLTFGMQVKNNGAKQIGLQFELYLNLDGDPNLSYKSGNVYLAPGQNTLTATVQTDSLAKFTVGSDNYAEFRLNFTKLNEGAANFDLYLYKSEFGKLHTSNTGSN